MPNHESICSSDLAVYMERQSSKRDNNIRKLPLPSPCGIPPPLLNADKRTDYASSGLESC